MPLSTSISNRLRYQHQSLTDIIAGLSREQLQQHPNPGKWSPLEQITHLATYQPVFIRRLRKMREEDSPAFDRYSADSDPLFPIFLERPLTELLHDIRVNGGIIADELATWDDAALRRKGRHPKYGLLSATQWAEFYLLHEAHHLFVIFMLAQELRADKK